MASFRMVLRILGSPVSHWVGDGFPVRSVFNPQSAGPDLSPFLLLDYAGPAEFPPAESPRGVGEHPHRGFETVTIVYQGEVEHGDSAGNGGRIGPGDVQWMTAASGVVHEEMHGREFTRRGGTMEMVQLWVNLPARFKMSPPAYQTLLAASIPSVPLAGGAGTARVIAGALDATRGPARTFTPINLWDLRLNAGTRLDLPVPRGHTTALFVLRGALALGGAGATGPTGATAREGRGSLGAAGLALFAPEGDRLSFDAVEETAALVMTGEPIDEPVVSYGPFVMNTQQEIRQAVRDAQAGRLGRLARREAEGTPE